ncbi:MAG: Dabb family protein [Thermodesulfobacteriota bacterium]
MIKHIVFWKLKEAAEGGTKAENARKMKALLEALPAEIEEIERLEVGLDFSATPDSFDVVLSSEFASRADLETYQKHPAHLKAGEFVKKVRLERKIVDYEV